MKPDFFIVGAPKCGTTSLYRQLAKHPQIFMSTAKEPSYFAFDLYVKKPRTTTITKYESYFHDAQPGQILGEASTSYLYSKCAAREIYKYNPNAKIIAMLRDPVEMMHSFHSQLLYSGEETIEDFELALRAEEERRPRVGRGEGVRFPHVLLYRDVARFSEQLERYLEIFGRERVHVILLDDYQEDPSPVYADTLKFLGVSTNFRPDFKIVNQYKGLRSRHLHRFLVLPPRAVQAAVSIALPPPIRYRLLGGLMRLNTVPQVRPPMSDSLASRLRSELSSEVTRLSKLIDRDLSAWSSGR